MRRHIVLFRWSIEWSIYVITVLSGQNTTFPTVTALSRKSAPQVFTDNHKRTARVRRQICVKSWGTEKDKKFSMFAYILFNNFIFVYIWHFKLCMHSCICVTRIFYYINIKTIFSFQLIKYPNSRKKIEKISAQFAIDIQTLFALSVLQKN